MSNYEPIHASRHGQLRLKPTNGFSFAAPHHLVSVVLHEFPNVSVNYPIVFVKAPETGKYRPVALLGLEPGKNPFVDAKGQWQAGTYIPAAFRRYPFALAEDGSDNLTVCIDTESPFVGTQEGERLFDEQGLITPVLGKIRDFLKELSISERMAQLFCDRLVELDLLVPGGLQIQEQGQVRQYDGSYVIDENRLAKLTAEQFLSLREQGFIAAVYSHLTSLLQLQKLVLMRGDAASPAA